MQIKFVALFFFYLIKSQVICAKNSESLKKVPSGFFYTMPKTLLSGRNETVCLSTHYSSSLPIKIIVDLKIKQKHFFTTRILDTAHTCFDMIVPNNSSQEPQFASVRVQVLLNGTIYSAHNQDPVIIYPNKKHIFIESDRATYKSEDKVKIRILTLLQNMLPPRDYKIPQVRIRNPLGVGVVVWENVSTELGLAQLEHQLSRDPVEGKWTIEAEDETKTFEVNKYILPRFKVDVIYPKIIYYKSSSVTLKVCARYTHGGIVKGNAFIRLADSHHNMQPVQVLKKMKDGCAEFSFANNELNLSNLKEKFSLVDPKIHIHITATVTEYGTDKTEITMGKSLVTLKAYNLKFSSKNLLLPGLPYQGKVEFNNIHLDLKEEVMEICYNLAIKKSWNYLNNEQCSNFTIGSAKTLQFHILPLKSNVIHLQLNVRSLNHSELGDSLLLVRLYSPSSSYIMIEQAHNVDKAKCGAVQQFVVQYTADRFKEQENVTFYYMIKSRGRIFKLRKIDHSVHKHHPNYTNEYVNVVGAKHKHVKNGSTVGKFVLKFKLDANIISNYYLLVYYITDTGEVVSAYKEVEVEPCLNNKVDTSWSHRQIAPGGTASLLIQTKSDSLCSIAAIDKAVKFMDDFRLLNVKSLLAPFLQEPDIPESGRKSCLSPAKKSREASNLMESDAVWDLKRKKRYVYSFSEDFDAYDIFNKFGTITITNFKVVTKFCYTGPIPPTNNPVQFLTDHYDPQNEDNVTPIRSFFPETWLWELVPVRGAAVIHRNLPHTITSWETNVLCVSDSDGVGFGKTTEIVTYQPFFVDVLTPYSIKRGETLYLNVIVFNYLYYNIPIRITLGSSEGLKLVDTLNRKSISYCVSANNTATHTFEMKGVEIGNVNVTVLAELDSSYPGHCGPDVLVNKRDVVLKTMIIEPEGYPYRISKSALLCASDDQTPNNITWDLKIPENTVPRTSRTKIVLNGDILGQTIEHLDDLVMMPTGCGEQIMATLVPNFYVLRYLNVTNRLTPSLKHRIIRNLKIGYQRILNYAHRDGSFSAFGYHDSTGSMFLTAFVVRTLQNIKQYIYVDQRVIERAVSWILNHQLENGCFNTMSHVFQDMGGTNTENSTAALTSYVMISLIDSNIQVPESVQTNAKYCIRGHYHLDKYTLAISSYALFKINWYSEANRMLKKLTQLSSQRNNMMWWTHRETNNSLTSDIEVTSYVLLSLLHYKTQENLAKAHSIVRWLSTKLGPRGAFQSTQDTVVALDALSRYAQFVNSKQINLEVNLEALDQTHQFKIKNEDRMKSKKIILKRADNRVKIDVNGEGCLLVQAFSSYYLKEIPSNDAFKLDMEISPVSNIDECSITKLSPCFNYNGPDIQANMAILEVDLPSGYEADRASLYKLIDEDTTTKIKMFEELQQKIVLYLTKLDNKPICVDFNINENAIVHSKSESTIQLYDYYKPEYRVSQFYKISDKCKLHNVTMPEISLTSIETSSENVKNIVKRYSGRNPDFVNVDFEMETPQGREGNIPTYMKFNSNTARTDSIKIRKPKSKTTVKALV